MIHASCRVTCHLIGCSEVFPVMGDGGSISEMIGEGEDRRRVYFCTIEHAADFLGGREPKRPGVISAPAPEGTGDPLG